MGVYESGSRPAISKLTVAGAQVLKRPGLLLDAVRKFDLRALYLPDRKRILLDSSQPDPKQRWNEAHEIGHSILPWHDDLMLGDNDHSVTPACHEQIEGEANYAAGQLLFMQSRFRTEANDVPPSISSIRSLKGSFGNTYTTTFWRFIEDSHPHIPMIGLIGGHPRYPTKTQEVGLVRHVIESPSYKSMFASLSDEQLLETIRGYCSYKRAGPLGTGEIVLTDKRGERHSFLFETFSNTYDCLTLGVYVSPYAKVVGF